MKTKNYRAQIIFCVIMSIIVFGLTTKAQISVVTSKSSVRSMTKNDIWNVFTGVKVVWSDGEKVQVIDQSESATGKEFYEKFVKSAAYQFRLQWAKLVLSGEALCPKKLEDDWAVRKAVADDPNAIGYIRSSALDESVRELLRIE